MRKSALILILLLAVFFPLFKASAETVGISAIVPANNSDFSAEIVTSDILDPVGQAHIIPFTITFSNKLSYAATITLKATWSKGTIQGDLAPSTDVLHYVGSSASDGYSNSSPVIDTLNRTITWVVPSFPGNNLENSVTFSLATSDSLTSSTPISFEVSTNITGPGTLTQGNTIVRSFKTDEPPTTATNTPGPTSANSSSTPTPTPQSGSSARPIQDVTIRTIQSTESDIAVTFLSPSSVTLEYGTSSSRLDQAITYTTRARTQVISLRGLKPSTTYYLRITSKDAAGNTTISDIYTLKTSSEDLTVLPEINSFVISSNEVILASGNDTKQENSSSAPIVILPARKLYEFRFSISDVDSIKDIRAFLRNKKVLGLNSIINTVYAETELVDLIETSPGVYLGRLRAPLQPGIYELYLRLSDVKGNVIEKKVSEVKVTNPFTVLASGTNETIEGAEATLYFYNSKKKTFQKIQRNSLSLKNPLFTDKNGEIDLVLPHGRYKAIIKTLHYKETSREFSIGEKSTDGYPTIYLQSASFDPLSYASYFMSGINDVFINATGQYIDSLTSSKRMLHLTILSVLTCLLLLSLLSTSARMQIPLTSLPSYLLHHIKRIFHNGKIDSGSIEGTIIDHISDRPLIGANIYILSPETRQILSHAITGKSGGFKTVGISAGTYKISILKSGYQALQLTKTLSGTTKLSLALAAHPMPESLRERILHFTRYVLSTSFEVLLFGSLILLVAIALQNGWKDILPLVMISGSNVILWYLHRR